ncbi:MAG: AraC family transcriptional regulator [Sphingobium sp.]
MLSDQSPIALRRRRVFETIDLDLTRDRISRVLQPHELSPVKSTALPSNWPFYLDHIPVGRIDIGAIYFGESHVHVPEFADYHLFIMCLRGAATLSVDGQQQHIKGRQGILIAPGEQMRASFSQDCEQLFVRISREALFQHSGIHQLQFRREVDLASPQLGPWLRQLATIISDDHTVCLLDATPRLVHDYEQLLLSLLLAGQVHQDVSARNLSIAPACVRRAEAFIHSDYAEPLTLANIATAAGVPPRTLLASFRKFRETSPIRYLRDVRLDAARTALCNGTANTIADAATSAGLFHFGRFAQDYAERFGELPSQTLRKHP